MTLRDSWSTKPTEKSQPVAELDQQNTRALQQWDLG